MFTFKSSPYQFGDSIGVWTIISPRKIFTSTYRTGGKISALIWAIFIDLSNLDSFTAFTQCFGGYTCPINIELSFYVMMIFRSIIIA
jgi:hypothetical protein